jgi:hypothetical protein
MVEAANVGPRDGDSHALFINNFDCGLDLFLTTQQPRLQSGYERQFRMPNVPGGLDSRLDLFLTTPQQPRLRAAISHAKSAPDGLSNDLASKLTTYLWN